MQPSTNSPPTPEGVVTFAHRQPLKKLLSSRVQSWRFYALRSVFFRFKQEIFSM